MTIKEYEHCEAQEHFADCRECQKWFDEVIVLAIKKEKAKWLKEGKTIGMILMCPRCRGVNTVFDDYGVHYHCLDCAKNGKDYIFY